MICEESSKDKENQRLWFQILTKQSEIYLYKETDNDILDTNNPLYLFSKSYQIKYIDASNYIKEVLKDNSLVLKFPSPVFLLDIVPQEAKKIQNQFGVIFQSIHDLNDKTLTNITETFSPDEEDNNYTWSYIFEDIKKMPSNCLLIVDRYLFANDRENYYIGVDNVIQILDELIPKSLNGDFIVTIVIDYESFRNFECIQGFKKITTKLNKEKSKLRQKRNFNIIMELIGICRCSNDVTNFKIFNLHHNKTHNRRIATNYMITCIEHYTAYFNEGKCLGAQKIDIDTLYSKGLSNRGDAPNKIHNILIRDVIDLIELWKKEPSPPYLFSKNGNCNVSIEELQNRLLLRKKT